MAQLQFKYIYNLPHIFFLFVAKLSNVNKDRFLLA